MVQLSLGFATTSTAMSIGEAVALATNRLPVAATAESIALSHADGRIAAEDVFARNNLPPFANSAVDGYAVRHADLALGSETMLPVGGRLAAGAAQTVSASGRAVRIFTGAAMPHDADTVFMQEDVRIENGCVSLPAGLSEGANMRRPGEDVAEGELIISAGRRLRPQDIALAGAAGHDRLSVRKRLRVAIFSTGNELLRPGARLRPGSIYDSNRIMLAAMLTRLGAKVLDLGILRDDPDVLAERLIGAAEASDLILSSGGVSLGEEDHVKAVVEKIGRLVFWRLAIKPGRPLAMGTVGSTSFIGLPGNPVAVYVTFAMFVRPIVAHLAGAAPEPLTPFSVRSAFAYRKRPGRREYVRVHLTPAANGQFEARRFSKEGAALLTSLTRTDGLVELAEDATAVAVGDPLPFYPHDAFR